MATPKEPDSTWELKGDLQHGRPSSTVVRFRVKPKSLIAAEDRFLRLITSVSRLRQAIDTMPRRHRKIRPDLEKRYDQLVEVMWAATDAYGDAEDAFVRSLNVPRKSPKRS